MGDECNDFPADPRELLGMTVSLLEEQEERLLAIYRYLHYDEEGTFHPHGRELESCADFLDFVNQLLREVPRHRILQAGMEAPDAQGRSEDDELGRIDDQSS